MVVVVVVVVVAAVISISISIVIVIVIAIVVVVGIVVVISISIASCVPLPPVLVESHHRKTEIDWNCVSSIPHPFLLPHRQILAVHKIESGFATMPLPP